MTPGGVSESIKSFWNHGGTESTEEEQRREPDPFTVALTSSLPCCGFLRVLCASVVTTLSHLNLRGTAETLL
jgi:hypothetical protein